MSNNIKGFKIKGQVYPIENGSSSGNSCYTCAEELIPLITQVESSGDYHKELNLEKLGNYLYNNFDQSNLTDPQYELKMLYSINSSSGEINIREDDSEAYIDAESIGFSSRSFSINPPYTGILGVLQYAIQNHIHIEQEYDYNKYPSDDIIKLYTYVGYDSSGEFRGEFKPITLEQFAEFFDDVENPVESE